MKAAIEFHDSDCIAIEANEAGTTVIVLDAYVHRNPTTCPHEGGFQRVHITMNTSAIQGDLSALPAEIYRGSLSVPGLPSDMIPLPSQSQEEFTLSLTLSGNARVIEFAGRGVTITPVGQFRFLEIVPFGE
jgi:hypothetical protein